MRGVVVASLCWAGCASNAPESASDPCALARLPAHGPLEAEARQVGTDFVALAEVRLRETRLTGDPGFDTLADLALQCALSQSPDDARALELRGHVWINFHRFAEAEALLAPLEERRPTARTAMWLGDARMEQGDLSGAAPAYDRALALRPSLEIYDRLAHLAWLKGDLVTAIELQREALTYASEADPEPLTWVLAQLGWYVALQGGTPNELGRAVLTQPNHPTANLLLGKFLLADGRADLAEGYLRKAGPTVEALRTLAEIDPTVDVSTARLQDRRGFALWLGDTDPTAALALLDRELADRHDATTTVYRAWVADRLGQDVHAAVRDALSTGIAEPRVLLLAAEIEHDSALAIRALEGRAGLLPSERRRAEAVLATALERKVDDR